MGRQVLRLAAVALLAAGLAGSWPDLRACSDVPCLAAAALGLAGAAGLAFLVWVALDYLFHHARLALLPAAAAVLGAAALYPSFAFGLGLSLLVLLHEGPPPAPRG